jgi:hypothetical protein
MVLTAIFKSSFNIFSSFKVRQTEIPKRSRLRSGGYHKRPMNAIAQKLLIKAGQRWMFYNAPENYLATLEPLPEDVEGEFTLNSAYDGVQLFVKNSGELVDCLKIIVPVLKPFAIFWVCYRKKNSGIKTDLEIMGNWDEPAKYGLATVAAVSINE